MADHILAIDQGTTSTRAIVLPCCFAIGRRLRARFRAGYTFNIPRHSSAPGVQQIPLEKRGLAVCHTNLNSAF